MSRIAAQSIALTKTGGRNWIKRLLIVIIFISLVIWAISPLSQRLDQQRELSSLKLQMSGAKDQESTLHQEIIKLQSDNDYIELMARKKLGMIKPGEDGYIVVEPGSAAKTDGQPAQNSLTPKR